MTVTKAIPDLLEAYTTGTTNAVAQVEGTLGAYRLALARLAAAPSDLAVPTVDRSPMVAATLRTVAAFDRTPAAYASLLRRIDAQAAAVIGSPTAAAAFGTGLQVHRVTSAGLGVIGEHRRVRAIRALRSAQWSLEKLKVRRWLAWRWALLRAVPSRVVLGRPSVRAAARMDGVVRRFGPAIDGMTDHVRLLQRSVLNPPPVLGAVGKAVGTVGKVTALTTAVVGSPYGGVRGVIDQGVAVASVAAAAIASPPGAALVGLAAPALATGLAVTAGVVLVGATAWAVGNLVADVWTHRKQIAAGIASAGRAVRAGIGAGAEAVGRGLQGLGERAARLGAALGATGAPVSGATS